MSHITIIINGFLKTSEQRIILLYLKLLKVLNIFKVEKLGDICITPKLFFLSNYPKNIKKTCHICTVLLVFKDVTFLFFYEHFG